MPLNRLADEISPYLLQHASNPVDWFPWGDEALELAKRADKPIFLSIGYSTCHWCHVMERESFEDAEVANLLNDHYVPIKIDREQRPDLDHIYMAFTQALTGRGGWPNTLILTPDRKPFFAGTYFPKSILLELLRRIAELWLNRRRDLESDAVSIAELILPTLASPAPGRLSLDHAGAAASTLMQHCDSANGGFGASIKFPQPTNLILLLRTWHRTREPALLEAVEHTLRAMRRGGIYDQIGYGIHRYSTDAHWEIPHFEKMLYDQALLCLACVECFAATENPFYKRIANEVLIYVDRDLSDKDGGFFSAQDADSEGVEGKYYAWTNDALLSVLNQEEADFALAAFKMSTRGNFEGLNVLRLGDTVDIEDPALIDVQQKLLRARSRRIEPMTDDKVMTDWNGLMIAAFAAAGARFGIDRWIDRARRAAHFIFHANVDAEGRFLHMVRNGLSGSGAGIDDYAFMLFALIELYQADFNLNWLERALALVDGLDRMFGDSVGGFFMSQADDSFALTRPQSDADGAIPSGGAVAAQQIIRLARIVGSEMLEERGRKAFHALGPAASADPSSHPSSAIAVDLAFGPSSDVVIVTPTDEWGPVVDSFRKIYAPRAQLVVKTPSNAAHLAMLAPFTAEMKTIDGMPTYFVCRNGACDLPTTSFSESVKAL